MSAFEVRLHISLACLLGLGLPACGQESAESTVLAGCPAGNEIAGTCAGVSTAPVCEDDVCTAGVSCNATHVVASDGEIAAAVAGAAPGSCIAIGPGNYGPIALPGGVSLLGKGAGFVTVQGLNVTAGSGTVVRGLTVGAGGMRLDGATEARVEAVRVSGSLDAAIDLRAGSSATVKACSIEGGAAYGIAAFDSGDLTVEDTLITGLGGPGLWAECTAGCDCPAPSNVALRRTILRDNKLAGLALRAVRGVLESVDVRDNSVGDDFVPTPGLAVWSCADVTAKGIRVADNSSYGVLVHGASLALGAAGEGLGAQIERNTFGMWVQEIREGQGVVVDNAEFVANAAVGIGTGGEAIGIIIYGTEIRDTTSLVVPVLEAGAGAGSKEVGDGLAWLDGSQLTIDGLSLSNNARASVLIDGAVGAGSSIANVVLSGGDEAKGILQQAIPEGGATPTVGASAPAVQSDAARQFAVPAAPQIPSGP